MLVTRFPKVWTNANHLLTVVKNSWYYNDWYMLNEKLLKLNPFNQSFLEDVLLCVQHGANINIIKRLSYLTFANKKCGFKKNYKYSVTVLSKDFIGIYLKMVLIKSEIDVQKSK